MPSIDNLCFIKKQLELMKYSVECDTKQKSLTMIKYYLSLAIQAANCNREIINALCNWREVLINEYINNATGMLLLGRFESPPERNDVSIRGKPLILRFGRRGRHPPRDPGSASPTGFPSVRRRGRS